MESEVNTLNLEHGDPGSELSNIPEAFPNPPNQLGDFGLVDADGIYNAVRSGLCVNEITDPTSGDTLLHAATKQDAPELTIALLQCGADTRLRNRLGRSPADEASPAMLQILNYFQPSLPEAVDTCNAFALRTLCQSMWVNIHATIRSGRTAMQIVADSRQSTANRAYKVLSEFSHLTAVIHALLANDRPGLESSLKQGGFLPPKDADHLHRMRQCPPGPDGRTLLTIALDRGDLESARLLLEAGASSRGRQMAVSASDDGDSQMLSPSTQSKPLAWSVFRNSESSPTGTARSSGNTAGTEPSEQEPLSLGLGANEAPLDLILEYDPVALLTQRDSYANTTLHGALVQNCELSKLAWLIERRPDLLAERNAHSQCVRELALALYRNDALALFEKTVRDSIGATGSNLISMLGCRGHGDCCLRESRVLSDDMREETGALIALAAERGTALEKSLLCSADGLNRLESIGRDHLKACADGNLKTVQKTNFAAFQEAATGCTGLIAAISGEHIDVVSYLLATRGAELTRIADNTGRFPMHYVYALMQHETIEQDDGIFVVPPESLSDENVAGKPHMIMARLIAKSDPTCWTLEDSLGRKPIDMSLLWQSPEAKNMLWAGWMAGRSANS